MAAIEITERTTMTAPVYLSTFSSREYHIRFPNVNETVFNFW